MQYQQSRTRPRGAHTHTRTPTRSCTPERSADVNRDMLRKWTQALYSDTVVNHSHSRGPPRPNRNKTGRHRQRTQGRHPSHRRRAKAGDHATYARPGVHRYPGEDGAHTWEGSAARAGIGRGGGRVLLACDVPAGCFPFAEACLQPPCSSSSWSRPPLVTLPLWFHSCGLRELLRCGGHGPGLHFDGRYSLVLLMDIACRRWRVLQVDQSQGCGNRIQLKAMKHQVSRPASISKKTCRLGLQIQCCCMQEADQGLLSMELSKLSKSPSLLRSPTIKSGINSLTSLDELERSHEPSKSRLGCWPQTSGNRDGRAIGDGYGYLRERLQLLVPPSIIVAVPFVWWCVKAGPSYGLKWLSLDIVPWYWFNVSALLVMFVAVVVSIHLAGPHLFGRALANPRWGVVRDAFGQSWHFVNSSCLQPFGAILQLSDKKESGWKVRLQSQGSRSPRSPGFTKPKKSQGNGKGVQTFSNGDVYEGEFYRGKFSGSGVYYFYQSGRYEGDWVDGKYDGHGVETWARGSRYRGQYRQGMREGYGIYRFYTGDVYSGHWSNGQSHGCGMQTCGDGSCYVGEFKWGVKHGVGYYHFRNGDTYAGEYFADKMHGYGAYKFANGHRYDGSWHDGRKQGLGIYTFRNGDTHAGHWHLGTLESRSTQVPNVSSPVAVNHSKVLNAVQEARKAAQRGMDVEKVDDRVKKVVALANQAANGARVAAVKAVHR